jgi:hypothetical protein
MSVFELQPVKRATEMAIGSGMLEIQSSAARTAKPNLTSFPAMNRWANLDRPFHGLIKALKIGYLNAIYAIVLLVSLSAATARQPITTQTKPRSRVESEIENAAGLASFFRALTAIKSGRRLEPVRIMHFGDSHTAADILTGQIRRKFQAEFGNGGSGFIVPRNPMTTRRRGVSSGATGGWIIEGIGGRVPADRILGPAGIALSTLPRPMSAPGYKRPRITLRFTTCASPVAAALKSPLTD